MHDLLRSVLHTTYAKTFEQDYEDAESGIFISSGTKLEPNVIIYGDVRIGPGCIIGASAIIMRGVTVGTGSIIGTLSILHGNNAIGDHTTIHSQCHITWGMNIGSCVFMGPMFCSTNTRRISKGKFGYPNTTDDPRSPPAILDGARIGGGVTIAPGVTVGKEAMVNMGCALVRDVPDGATVRRDYQTSVQE